jgi:glycine oxidase
MRNVARSSDIIVIGAGIVGCAIACELVRRGASVSILDARAPGGGATQASGGMLAPYSEAAAGGPLLALGARSLGLFDEFVATLEGESGTRVGYERSGTLHIARAHDSLAEFDATHRELEAMGAVSERLSAAAALAQEPNLAADVLGGLLIPNQGAISAPEMTRALAVAARRRGAGFLDPARARRIGARTGGIVIETERGSLQAGAVVLAAGAWSSQIAIDGVSGPVPVKPVRGQLLHLHWPGTQVARITWDERCYLVPWRDGTLLVGATVEDAGFEERTTVSGVQGLLDAVCSLLPLAASASLLSARVGLRPRSPDPLPIVGWSDVIPGLMYATGHYRNGVLLAPLTAQIVADAMVNGTADPALALTRPSRFGRL